MYNAFFSLDALPFLITPQVDVFQGMEQHQAVIATVQYALSQGDACVQVVGEVGVGKTMTLRYLMRVLEDQYHICYLPNGYMSMSALCAHIIYDLMHQPHPPRSGGEYQLEDVHRCLLEKYQEGKHVVLCVDEAQTLSTHHLECLRLMTNLETDDRKLAQLVLFGQPEFKKKLSEPGLRQLAQRIQYRVEIMPGSLAQIHGYLSARLVAAGHPHGDLFSEAAVECIYRYTQGVFRLVNVFAHHALMSAYVHHRQQVVPSDVHQAARELQYPRLPWWQEILMRLRSQWT